MRKLLLHLAILSLLLLIIQFSFFQVSGTTCIETEREALLRLKKSFVDPSHLLASWKGMDCCNWDGVLCNKSTGHVTELDLRNAQVYDSDSTLDSYVIDSNLLEFKYLNHLDLSGNFFSNASNLMQVLSSLPVLSSLRLSSCRFQNAHLSLGSLNSSFLTRIQFLDLSGNNFNGSIPKTFQNMTSLRYLYLSYNHFTGIEGGISSLIEKNCGIKVVDLSENPDFGGDVFGSYENISGGCKRYNNLQELDLSSTNVGSKFPNWLGRFENLQFLDLSGSNISGPIPASFGNLSNIQHLHLSYNHISGALPTFLGRLLNLRTLDLGHNRLEGEVGVECFSQLGSLEMLDISGNLFKGVVTEAHFANLSSLHDLWIGYNGLLSLDMKSDWVPPFQLNTLDASSCVSCFGSKFPQWLPTQKRLVYLRLYNTSISSALPTWLTGQNLTQLDLSYNQIVGPLPTTIGDQMPNLEELQLNNNLINGSLPQSACKWKNLLALDLSNNKLVGTAHGCFLTSNLLSLDLSFNNFSGTFPHSLGNLSNIEQLYLGKNNFQGSMPTVLKNFKYLTYLGLEGNHFSGIIPAWVGHNLRYLRFLKLRGNRFNGSIPSSLCLLPHLQILDLAHNQLRGNIPPHLSNFSAMAGKKASEFSGIAVLTKHTEQYLKSMEMDYSFSQLWLMMNIDLSNNSLVGFIPSEITTLEKLVGLNLSHNNLVGTIPTEMGAMESLESLDLSFNRLSGSIPRSMSQLSSLGVLKLSHNNLSGNIPREGHLSTFNEASSFEGNQFLCGDPLPVQCGNEKPTHGTEKLRQEDQEDKWEKWVLYIAIMLGYATGFWAVVGSLILKRSWRYAYFKFVDDTRYKLHAAVWWSIDNLKQICIHK